MESREDEENNFSDVIDNIMNMFGKVMSKDVISAVVESCEGDLNLSVDAIMNMTNDGNVITEEEQSVAANQNMESIQSQAQPVINTTQVIPMKPLTSYASASATPPAQSTGAIKKVIQKPIQHNVTFWTDQTKDIITNHNQGNRILIFMRGAPGSGKSHLAQQLVEMMIGASAQNYSTHILSTDDYFNVRGQYQYNKYKLPEAHQWNQARARHALQVGLSPVIIDNTNIELWEMEPYLRDGISNGYIIQVVEPQTPWAKKANQLVKTNKHDVPLVTIKRMLDNYREGITGEILKRTYGLACPAGMVPPVKRTFPPIATNEPEQEPHKIIKEHTATSSVTTVTNTQYYQSSTSTINVQTHQKLAKNNPQQQNVKSNLKQHGDKVNIDRNLKHHEGNLNIDHNSKSYESKQNVTNLKPSEESSVKNKDNLGVDQNDDLTEEEQEKLKLFLEAQKKLEEIEKVEIEWENNDSWDTDVQDPVKEPSSKTTSKSSTIITSMPDAKPQRKTNVSPPLTPSKDAAESLMQNVNDCQDWSKIAMFMPPWNDSSEPSTSAAKLEAPVESVSNGTCMEIGDTNVNGKYKVISATPRNINEFYISFNREKIPQKRMFDKSSMTNEGMIMDAFRCPNEEKHFIAFRKLFKNIARSDLRDIFDKCCGDVNWSVEIVLDGMNNNQFKTVDSEELSDAEEENTEPCACLANYNVIPDVATPEALKTAPVEEKASTAPSVSQSQKKKRDVTVSDESIQIKRQIEQNVVIADNHYSAHCLKIRKFRRGEPDLSENNLEEPGTSGLSADAPPFESNCVNSQSFDLSDEDDGASHVSDIDDDVIVTVNLGHSFIHELDEKFGRKDMQYPAYIVPKISLPLSILNQINALWMESLTYQLDEHAQKTAVMVQQDEEFARQIAMKEAELSLAGKEPEVPDFKEIMDMDMALAMYQKDVAEWRNNMPTDLAAKMTRDKLYNLFPDVDKDTLTELLMAYDNNFNATVEALLMSTGRNDVLEQENGINKFVLTEELKLKEKIMEEQKKELSETEWPLLSKGEKVDMATVQAYREEADNHLARRNLNYQKAQEYVRRGMTQVANYYSELANFHKQKYEYANGLAVASLMQFHATNNPDCTTIDLHYLRVKEAKESLDVFIDAHISKLRDSGVRRNQMLFFITGRGSHSQGRARIKPAAIERLKQRGLGYSLKNPGLLAAKVNVDTKLTYQVSVP